MSAPPKSANTVARRHLLVLGAAVGIETACSGADSPLGGPYGGVAAGTPSPTHGGDGGSGSSSSSGSGSGSSGSSSSGSSSGSSGSGSSGSGSGSGSSSGSSGSGSSSSGSSGSGSSGSSSSGSGSSSSSSGGDAGPACSCPSTGKVLSLPFSKYPQLMNVGGSVTLNASGYSDPNCGLNQIIVIQTAAGKYSALSTSCTHACCPVILSGSELRCPCHGATFDLTGKHTSGPGSGNLGTLPVCADSCGVTVTIA